MYGTGFLPPPTALPFDTTPPRAAGWRSDFGAVVPASSHRNGARSDDKRAGATAESGTNGAVHGSVGRRGTLISPTFGLTSSGALGASASMSTLVETVG